MLLRFTLLLAVTSCLSTPLVSNPLAFAQEPTESIPEAKAAPRWWKGNLHTHSLWSDGNDFPEMISDWYRQRGYHFLAISDHNVLQEGSRWMSLKSISARGASAALGKYRERFGSAWVETRGEEGTDSFEVRLKPLDEYRYLLEERGSFILIPAEEITDKAEGKPVHMNATNLAEVIQPLGGKTVREAMENNLRAIFEQEKAKGREILPHLNHPNFGYGITFEDLAAVMAERFFEVYNGHPGVNHRGDADRPGVERMWDLANHLRVNKLGGNLLMGVATDDSHEYFGKPGSRPGRGWVMVRCQYLTPEHLIRAMKAGDFYASSGVSLRDVQWDRERRKLSVAIQAEAGVTYTTEYVVTSSDAEPDQIGRVAYSTNDLESSYRLADGETIVRAVVTSSLTPVDPVFDDQKQQAWTQPFTIVE
ncbi:MAG: hypothetical protein MUF23_02725 [Pirellula sp.]|jgi:hypothetical protein|nr:hypothetical protein [Pirellula sp.]